MRGKRIRYLMITAMLFGLMAVGSQEAAAQRTHQIDYWRAKYGELTPTDDPRVQRARIIFARLLQAAGKRPGVTPQLLITKRDPWSIALPIALPDGGIILSKPALDLCYTDSSYGDDRLAFVLGHELAHQLGEDLWDIKFFGELDRRLKEAYSPTLEKLNQWLKNKSAARWSEELRADRRGIIYAAIAGFNTQAVVTENFFRTWMDGLGLTPSLDDTNPSHPDAAARDAALKAHLAEVMRKAPLFEAGLWFLYAGNYSQAISAFEHLSRDFPSREVYHNLALSHHLLALQAYRSWQGEPALPFDLAMILDPMTRASRIFLENQARAQRNSNPETDYKAQFTDHLDKAIRLYREALTLDETYMPAYHNLGGALLVRGVHSKDNLRSRDGEPPASVYEAVAKLQQALEQGRKEPESLNSLGVAYYYVHGLDIAKEPLERARTLAPAYAAPVFNLAMMAKMENRRTEAQHYQRAYELLVKSSRQLSPNPSGEHVEKLAIGYLEGEAPLSWGKALRDTDITPGFPFAMATYSNGIRVLTRDGEILMLRVQGRYPGASAGEVSIGSGTSEVLARYGSPTRRLEIPHGTIWAYDDHRIAFQLYADKVISWLLF